MRIDDWATPNNPVIDITDSSFHFFVTYQEKGAPSPTPHLPPLVLNVFPFSSKTLFFFSPATVLSTQFNNAWLMAESVLQGSVTKNIADAVSKINGGFQARNINFTLPPDGALKAIVANGTPRGAPQDRYIVLSYQLPGARVDFAVSTPITGGLIPDPTFKVTFDVEILVYMLVPPQPGGLSGFAEFWTENGHVEASNTIADIGDAIVTAWDFFNGQPTRIFQTAEGKLDQVDVELLPQLLVDVLADLNNQAGEAHRLGFSQQSAFVFVDPNNQNPSTINLQWTHPVDFAPVVVNAADSPFPNLFLALIEPDRRIVNAGQTITITGTNFPVGQASVIYIGWNDTTSGEITQSDIIWGQANTNASETVHVPRSPRDGNNTFTADGLLPATAYVFTVVDEDALTETPPSAPLTVTTAATDQVQLMLEDHGFFEQVGTAMLTTGGTFQAPITLPANLVTGTYTVDAVLSGQTLASCQIQVFAANQQLPQNVEVIDPNTQVVLDFIVVGQPFTVRGDGFIPGFVSLNIDTIAGTKLGASFVGGPGNFLDPNLLWPAAAPIGQRKIVASQTVNNQLLQASVSILVEAQPT